MNRAKEGDQNKWPHRCVVTIRNEERREIGDEGNAPYVSAIGFSLLVVAIVCGKGVERAFHGVNEDVTIESGV